MGVWRSYEKKDLVEGRSIDLGVLGAVNKNTWPKAKAMSYAFGRTRKKKIRSTDLGIERTVEKKQINIARLYARFRCKKRKDKRLANRGCGRNVQTLNRNNCV